MMNACGGESDDLGVLVQWRTDLGAPAAAPGTGSEGTVVAATSGAPGEIRTIDQLNGLTVQGPFATLGVQRAPVAVGAEVFFLTAVGRIARLNLAGQSLPTPDDQFGISGPLALGADAILRWGSTVGRLFGLRTDGTTVFDVTVAGASNAVDSAPAIDSAGRSYFALDGGTVVGIDTAGTETLRVSVPGPASGPSVQADRLAVGGLDGVYVYNIATQNEVFRHPRSARVVGTRWLASGDLLAWGEDGIVERLTADGMVVFTFTAGPPVYTPVTPVDGDGFAVIDNDGTAYRINAAGQVDQQVALGGTPSRLVAVTALGWVAVAVGNEVFGINFAAPR